MGYIHVEIETAQSSKKSGAPCGDVCEWERSPAATTMVCSDGLGSGIKANIAATMCCSRILQLIRSGASLRHAFANVVKTMNEARGTELPYAVFTVVRVLNDGEATVLTYEMPAPIFGGARHANVLPQRTLTLENTLIGEAHCHIEPGEGILIVSDGITQSGLGNGLRNGWGIEGVMQYTNDRLAHGVPLKLIPRHVHQRARELWGDAGGDDCTAALAACRWGKTVNILTGPPKVTSEDHAVISKFLMAEGTKVVCGATTAKIVARHLGTNLEVEQDPHSLLAPPRYAIGGIDLVTEGAVTLNQVYNIIDEDPDLLEVDTGVTQIYELLRGADRVSFTVGRAQNPAHGDIAFRQRGILPRATIVPLIGERLEKAGKLVVIDYV